MEVVQRLIVASSVFVLAVGLPSLRDSIRQPLHVYEGEDALLTCVVRNLETNTLLWKREDKERGTPKMLTAGESRVTSDTRFHVLHDSAPSTLSSTGSVASGGDVWVLAIKSTKPSDTGTYICEINSNPILRSFHTLYVIPSHLQPPAEDPVSTSENTSNKNQSTTPDHDYTSCCRSSNVTDLCLGFCSLGNILNGTTGQEPEECETEFPAIVKCMADGRNHVPCCVNEGVPDVCQDICRGEYSIPNDDIRTHISCSAYTEVTLGCIAEGIEILPKAPEEVYVDAISSRSLKISWKRPTTAGNEVNQPTHYYVNISALPSFDSQDASTIRDRPTSTPTQFRQPFSMQMKIPADQNSTIIDNLISFTMYEVTVTSHNSHGNSLPSLKVRSLTETVQIDRNPLVAPPPLPDIKECCTQKGIYHNRCVDKFCDPVRTADVSLPDLMVCAPWASDSFACLSNGVDHSACCRSRGLPEACIQLCSGNVTRVDYNQFRCIQYMPELSNCLLQGYGVLAGPPSGFRVTHIHPTFAILRWAVPKTLGKTVTSYNVHYRMTNPPSGDSNYKMINTKTVPFILEELMSSSEYEVYVTAVNSHGVGEPTARILFRTLSIQLESTDSNVSADGNGYNLTACCLAVGVRKECMPLCDFGAKRSDLNRLTETCSSGRDFPKLLRCGAGGRNHVECCQRRGIPKPCLGFCTGHVSDEMVVTAAACLPYIGNVVQCFEEGTGLIPGPIIQLKATAISDDSVSLTWQPPLDGSVDQYVVHYMMIEELADKVMANGNFSLDQQQNATDTRITIQKLKSGQLYNFFVLATNQYGSSLPSSVITVNITKEALTNGTISGVPSAPHAITVASRSADYITVTWQQPTLVHPTDRLTYKFYYRKKDDKSFSSATTEIATYRLNSLAPSSQHIFYVTAVNEEGGESRPSETLMAWTDPAYEPLVELPTVHPMNLVLEGGSMTVICVAMGTPMPNVSLYISGRLVNEEKTRHMVTVLSNVTRFMNEITCRAQNGFGQPAESSKRIIVGRRPTISSSLITMATLGDDVTLECQVDAHPRPKLSFSRESLVIDTTTTPDDQKYNVTILRESQEPDANYIMRLRIANMTATDSGVYYCNAQNNFGTFAQVMKLQTRQKIISTDNVAKCCQEQNVTSTCMDACTSMFLDVDSVIDKPECIQDFHKLMRCAADGSDHRGCCTQWGVPRRCLDWCRGEEVPSVDLCALTYTKPILSCFHEGKDRIPGPPGNLRIEIGKDNSIKAMWDPPSKNPDTVQLYRVFWRVKGMKPSYKNDTSNNWLTITGLEENAPYELVIKAGNRHGTSTLTEPVTFTLSDRYIISASTHSSNSHVGEAIGIVVALLLLIGAVSATVYWLHKKNVISIKLSAGSPVFRTNRSSRNIDTQQIIQNEITPNDIQSETSLPATIQQRQDVIGHQSASSLSNVNNELTGPSFYEELRLGADGVGFKRFK